MTFDVTKITDMSPTVAERDHLRHVHGVVFVKGIVTPCGLGYYPAKDGGYAAEPTMVGTPVVRVEKSVPGYHAWLAYVPVKG